MARYSVNGVARGVVDKKGGIGVGLVKSLVAIRLKTEG